MMLDRIVGDMIESAFDAPANVGKSAKEILEGVSSELKSILKNKKAKVNKVFEDVPKI